MIGEAEEVPQLEILSFLWRNLPELLSGTMDGGGAIGSRPREAFFDW